MGRYPGLGLPLRHWPQADMNLEITPPTYPTGAHPNIAGSKSTLLPIRELAMMGIMDRLTDKENWHKKVFDEAIVEKWREEAMNIPDEILMRTAAAPDSEWYKDYQQENIDHEGDEGTSWTKVKGIVSKEALDYCIQELRSKALYYEETGLIPTLDASATVVKSDVLVKDDLRDSLRRAFQKLQNDQAENPDWHPGSNEMVQDLVHPSMYPLIYGCSKVFEDEVVGTSDAVGKWSGKGDVIEKEETPLPVGLNRRPGVDLGGLEVPAWYWSNTYQWLPFNVSFQKDDSVKITSYINNLRPNQYPEIYSTIEKLIQTALPAWDQCLLEYKPWRHYGAGRKRSRFSIPEDADDEDARNWDPSDPAELADVEVDLSQDHKYDWIEDEEERKWKILRTPVLREPNPFVEVKYSPYPTRKDLEQPRPASSSRSSSGAIPTQAPIGGLRKKFKDTGLQIIAKMASIELTPEKPEFPVGGWHIEGQLNERICATALYYLDSENITDSSLSFRMHTSYDQDDLQEKVGQDSYHWLECVYATNLSHNGTCLQNYGAVETREGRLLAFPNVFQHRVSPFQLSDPTKPGHRRFIALWLVDPHCRVISTANVPPQQQDWWVESVFGRSEGSQKSAADKLPAEMVQLLREKGLKLPDTSAAGNKLPPELLDMIRGEFAGPTISPEEAREHRIKLMQERTAHQEEAVHVWQSASYSFCEH